MKIFDIITLISQWEVCFTWLLNCTIEVELASCPNHDKRLNDSSVFSGTFNLTVFLLSVNKDAE